MKKILCIMLVMAMAFSLPSCRKINEQSSYISTENSEISRGTVEIIEDDDKEDDDKEDDDKNSSTSQQDNSNTQNNSLSENSSSNYNNDASTTESQDTSKPYKGNLPTLSAGKLPQFANRQFEISGFWAPYEISEESFNVYKNAGFTTLAMINHSLAKTSQDQFYLSSERTMKALEICKKVGLKAILNYNDWIATWSENDLEYYSKTPFSQFDLYGDYKDIITGVHICDEPYKNKHFPLYGDKTLIDDFKKVYPNAKFIVNLIPYTAYASRDFSSYDEMMELYEKTFMQPFEKPFVSVDVYPFHEGSIQDDGTMALNYEYIANSAKKYGVKPGYILQSSVGGADTGKKEFEMELSEGDLRWEINSALAFGADTLQYYCYSVPYSLNSKNEKDYMYDYCILNRDNTPSPTYYHLQKLHKELKNISNVILAYDWDESIGILGTEDCVGRVAALVYDEDFNLKNFKDPKHFVSVTSTQEALVSRFTNKEYGEGYMLVNFADRIGNTVTAKFRDCKSVAIYDAAKGSTPQIVKIDKNGQFTLELEYGEGVFIIPLK